MSKTIMVAVCMALIGAPAALAQYDTKGGGSSDLTVDKSSRYNAPIGHRQPRPSDLPPEARDPERPEKVDPADAALNRKIKSICRGC